MAPTPIIIDTATRRLKKELADRAPNEGMPESPIYWGVAGSKFNELLCGITGPPGSPYEGGKFLLKMWVPKEYPYFPPKVCFLTKIWHPNVSTTNGTINLEMLYHNWPNTVCIRSLLLAIQTLLISPEGHGPQDAAVSLQLQRNPQLFTDTAKYWTYLYAAGPHKVPEFAKRVEELKERGVKEVHACYFLSLCFWNVQRAVEVLQRNNYNVKT